uniref:Sorting nexin-25 n=1 Tax=Daphnia magna TaxID=35525 RepID=A0A0P4YXH5_9CRUS
MLEVQIFTIWGGLIMVATAIVGIFASSFAMFVFFVASLATSVIGMISVFSIVIMVSPSHSTTSSSDSPNEIRKFQENIKEMATTLQTTKHSLSDNSQIIMNRSVSTTLQNLMDLIFRDLLDSILKDIILPTASMKSDAWEALHKFYCKISNIDPVQFITQDVVVRVTRHLEKIRLAQSNPENLRDKMISFNISSFLRTPQLELELLRKLADVIIVNLFPRSYVDCFLLRHALGELLACQVLQPGIDCLCDPDTINQQLVLQLHRRQMMKKDYAYAASYEDFVSLIEDCDDLEELRQIRYNIATEIAQATTIGSMRRAKGTESDQESLLLGSSKLDLLQARNLKRYIKQLTYAKLQCERRLRVLGAPMSDFSRSSTSTSSYGDEMVPSFKTVMRNNNLRRQLELYLIQQGETQVGLLKFWLATQELRRLDRKAALTSAAHMFYTYFNGSNQIIKLEKSLIKGMEAFIVGDKGPEAFFQAQDQVWKVLEERHYPSFLVVLTCQMTGRQGCETDSATDPLRERHFSWKEPWIADDQSDDTAGVMEWSEQTQFAKSRMEQVDARLVIKLQAMSSLRGVAPDSSLVAALEKEVESLQTERREVENWLNQAESWAAHMGQWKAIVGMPPQNPDEKENVRFPIELHLEDEAAMIAVASNNGSASRKRVAMSWTVWRQVAEFYALISKLSLTCPWLKSSQLPAVSGKSLFGKLNDRSYLERARDKLQSFLDTVMADDRLNKNEALFTFLHNTPVCLRQALVVDAPKKSNRFSLATLFKGDTPRESDDDTEQQQHDNNPATGTDETDSLFQSASSDDTRDGIAEPIYHLISEVFELRGVFGWLRRTLVTFVQITYGRTINRQLRDVIASLFTDQAVLGYVQLLVKTWWPDGTLVSPAPPRSTEEKRRTKLEVRDLLLANIPDVLNQLLGHKNAKRGTLKVLDALQDERLNKQLFYDILEVILKDGFPELSSL